MAKTSRLPGSKRVALRDAVREHVRDGDCVFVGGFGQCIPFAIAHEIIRQDRRRLVLCRSGADIVFDLLIAAGCVAKVVVGYIGNPGLGLAQRLSPRGRGGRGRGRGLDQFRDGPAPSCRGHGRAVPADGDAWRRRHRRAPRSAHRSSAPTPRRSWSRSRRSGRTLRSCTRRAPMRRAISSSAASPATRWKVRWRASASSPRSRRSCRRT